MSKKSISSIDNRYVVPFFALSQESVESSNPTDSLHVNDLIPHTNYSIELRQRPRQPRGQSLLWSEATKHSVMTLMHGAYIFPSCTFFQKKNISYIQENVRSSIVLFVLQIYFQEKLLKMHISLKRQFKVDEQKCHILFFLTNFFFNVAITAKIGLQTPH